MWKLTAALGAIALIVLVAYNFGGELLPASAGEPGLGAWTIDISFDESDMDLTDGVCETASGDCTLRAAIEQSNFETNAGCTPCTITFDPAVFPPGNPTVIQVDSELPDIVVPLTIDGKGAGVILEPGLGVPAFCGFCVLDDTPANPTDFTINGGGAFTIREFPVGVLIGGDAGGGFGFGPVAGVNLSGLDIDSCGFGGVAIFGQGGVTNVNVSDTSILNCGDGFFIDNFDGPTDGITFDSVNVDMSGHRGIAISGQSVRNVMMNNSAVLNSGDIGIGVSGLGGPVEGVSFNNVDIDSSGGSGINIEGESLIDFSWDKVRITNNSGSGIDIQSPGSAQAFTFGNVDIDSSGGSGINIDTVGGSNFTFDGGSVSNNGGAGISINSPSVNNFTFDSLDILDNGGAGMEIFSDGFESGDVSAWSVSRSNISGNQNAGVSIHCQDVCSGSNNGISNSQINGNGAGIEVIWARTGPTAIFNFTVRDNSIQENFGGGVTVVGASGVTISQNSMGGNVGLGIDLGGDGVTPNDPGDVDTGPNGLQNFPTIFDINTGTMIVSGEAPLFSTIELFLTEDPPDLSGFGEGHMFADGFESGDTSAWAEPFSLDVRAFAGPTGVFGVTISAFPCGLPAGSLTATATDADGNTSEFSANVPGFPGTEPCPPDKDGDGCTDAQELGLDENLGGRRDPNYFWDFFDPNQDLSVTLLDFLAVLRHFGAVSVPPPTKAEALAEAPLPEPPIGEYWVLADRGGQAPGGDPWDELPPNGSIGLLDFLSVLRQFGHTCA